MKKSISGRSDKIYSYSKISEKKDLLMTHTIRINGITFYFPYKPYPSQILSVSKMIDTMRNNNTCVIEAPTGTGKSLSILIAACGWLLNQNNTHGKKETQEQKSQFGSEHNIIQPGHDLMDGSRNMKLEKLLGKFKTSMENIETRSLQNRVTSLKKYSVHPGKSQEHMDKNQVNGKRGSILDDLGKRKSTENVLKALINNQGDHSTNEGFERKKIIICSRTHKQLDQLVQQLKGTVYTPRTSILASRKLLCINKKITGDYESGCRETIKRNDCLYFTNKDKTIRKISQMRDDIILNSDARDDIQLNLDKTVNKTISTRTDFLTAKNSVSAISRDRLSKNVLDLEESINLSKKCRGCPYFTVRGLVMESDIVFMPYNYFLDPSVRKTIDIDFKNSILIIDEAHNIEDSLCDAGSIIINNYLLLSFFKELQILHLKFPQEKQTLSLMNFFFKRVYDLKTQIINQYDAFQRKSPRKNDFCKKEGTNINESLNGTHLSGQYDNFQKDETYSVVSSQKKSEKENEDENISLKQQESEKEMASHTFQNISDCSEQKQEENSKNRSEISSRTHKDDSPLQIEIVDSFNSTDYILKGSSIKTLLNRSDLGTKLTNDFKSRKTLFNRQNDLNQNLSLSISQNAEQMINILLMIHGGMEKAYGLILTVEKRNKSNSKRTYYKNINQPHGLNSDLPFTIKFVLLEPSIIFHTLPYNSLILLSGTLSPFTQLERELSHKFDYSLIAPSIMKDNVFIRHVSSYNDTLLNGSYQNITSYSFIDKIIEIILQIREKLLNGGTVVFLPNYSIIKTVKERLESLLSDGEQENFQNLHIPSKLQNISDQNANSPLLNRTPRQKISYDKKSKDDKYSNPSEYRGNQKTEAWKSGKRKKSSLNNRQLLIEGASLQDKDLFVEENASFEHMFVEYGKRCERDRPILLCVYRGKSSEGTDFKDGLARAVLCVSLPYPNYKDPVIKLHREKKSGWYINQCYRALNQAIGRIVRNKTDWGGVFLLEERVDIKKLAGWVQERAQTEKWERILPQWTSFISERSNQRIK